MSHAWVELENVTFGYPDRTLFQNLSLKWQERGLVQLRGPSGAGKSTLALLLCGHVKPQAGSVRVAGEPMLRPCRRAILAAQEDDLFPWLTMKGQLDFCSSQPGAIQDWAPLAAKVELAGALSLYPSQMSGGMRKRLSLLRATILSPALLVLDETLASLEPPLREQILREFIPIWRERGVGVLLISHDEQARGLVNQVISIDELRVRGK